LIIWPGFLLTVVKKKKEKKNIKYKMLLLPYNQFILGGFDTNEGSKYLHELYQAKLGFEFYMAI
jgi:hypothetical protein